LNQEFIRYVLLAYLFGTMLPNVYGFACLIVLNQNVSQITFLIFGCLLVEFTIISTFFWPIMKINSSLGSCRQRLYSLQTVKIHDILDKLKLLSFIELFSQREGLTCKFGFTVGSLYAMSRETIFVTPRTTPGGSALPRLARQL